MNRRHVVRIQGGLGNQLFQWAFGMALAQRTGATVYHGIDFFAQAPGEHVPRALELSVFGLSPRPAPADVLEGIHRRDTRWNGWSQRLWPGLLAPPIVCERKPYTYDEAMFAQRADTLFDGYWQTERYFLPIAAEVREAFTFQHPMPSGVEQQADAIRSSMAVALHVRRGDYTYHAAASSYFATCEPAYYQQAMAHMLERVPDVRFFVFSDDPAWARANLPKLA
ncbi:MAG: alpha-1,2-fucosyltransferase, partial [Flavobacteriales bacterium]|nr:alpha-1,2-fucosyltransferase [Flavobacteriales bacterium]